MLTMLLDFGRMDAQNAPMYLPIDWHVGQSSPLPYDNVHQVIEVQADGDELEYIRDKFSNLPVRHNRNVVRYFGDTAKFIAGNL